MNPVIQAMLEKDSAFVMGAITQRLIALQSENAALKAAVVVGTDTMRHATQRVTELKAALVAEQEARRAAEQEVTSLRYAANAHNGQARMDRAYVAATANSAILAAMIERYTWPTPASGSKKTDAIKDFRARQSPDGTNHPGLKESREFVEALWGALDAIFDGDPDNEIALALMDQHTRLATERAREQEGWV